MVFETELKKLGLNDKESSVYLSCLQLGPSPVQPIARKAKVVRATTYVVLEALMEMGLVTKYKEGKKTLFAAEPPRQLMRLIEKEQEMITQKKGELETLLPELQILMKSSGDQPSVRYFAGIEGLRAMRQEIVMYSHSGDMIYNFTPYDHLNALFAKNETAFYQQRLAKGIKSKTLFSTQSEVVKESMLNSSSSNTEIRSVPLHLFPAPSGMTIYRDRIAIGKFTGKLGGVIVENQDMADMMRQLFDLAWQMSATIDKIKD